VIDNVWIAPPHLDDLTAQFDVFCLVVLHARVVGEALADRVTNTILSKSFILIPSTDALRKNSFEFFEPVCYYGNCRLG
jgi:hypothetical protein